MILSSLTKALVYLNKICNYESYNTSNQYKNEKVLNR